MDPKAQMLIWELSSSFDNCKVEYQYANELHKFRLEWDPTHWLYFARSFVDDHTERKSRKVCFGGKFLKHSAVLKNPVGYF